jgi:hypothetical protein
MVYKGVDLTHPLRPAASDPRMPLVTPRMMRGSPRDRKSKNKKTRAQHGVRLVGGKEVSNPAELRAAYDKGPFAYQFMDSTPSSRKKFSRVMICDNSGELMWLQGKIQKGARVIIRPGTNRNP